VGVTAALGRAGMVSHDTLRRREGKKRDIRDGAGRNDGVCALDDQRVSTRPVGVES
jgi:hypothetical protein